MNNEFEIIPAIDILDGKCVRLTQGKYDAVEEFSTDPVEIAKKWQDKGANRLHIVDLDGAKDGKLTNKKTVIEIIKSTNMEIEVGGGIRDKESINEYLENGVNYIILGTKAFQDKDFLNKVLDSYGEKIILGLDMKNGKVALSGWKEVIDISFNKLAEELNNVHQIIFTDIATDGMLTGPNIDSLKEVASKFNSKIIASGGISKIDDINNLLEVKKNFPNITGAILGKSLYKGTIDLSEAINLVKNHLKQKI